MIYLLIVLKRWNCRIWFKRRNKKGTKVYKTIDIKLNNYINETSINLRKVLIDGDFKVQNNKIIFTVTDKENTEKLFLMILF